ncbi:tryptophan synthase subunit alpha [Niveibacterium sp. 24ML]|uniref:tryptophan synthase subunit alpha n=1 Tax=Niveibacterium sp. 24ML TaxID=2985512 RepID=UPI0022715577|nr:tryptophan synthase subunit alpha [Niveibacterium sp. 24ML]MCX9155138.1 tryptophan synthase subunit alpha [Niveibacterium sp. 24ML]
MSRIQKVFARLGDEQRTALIPYIAAGDPSPDQTLPLMHALVAGGADVLEIGVPFSDPMADGPTIQRAAERALKHGVSLRNVLEMVSEFRKENSSTPIVLMGYANPIEAMGVARFISAAVEAGVDGVLVVDYPPEEASEFANALKDAGLDPIFLLAPTSTDERMDSVAQIGRGYAYYVSLKGVTGAGHLDIGDVVSRLPNLKQRLGMPVGVGFGIRDAASARAIGAAADAVVIGSRIIEEIESSPAGEAPARVQAFISTIRLALDEPVVESAR